MPPGDPSERYNVMVRLVNAADYGVPDPMSAFLSSPFVRTWIAGTGSFHSLRVRSQRCAEPQESGEYWDRHAMRMPGTAVPTLIPVEEKLAPWRTLRDAIRGSTVRLS